MAEENSPKIPSTEHVDVDMAGREDDPTEVAENDEGDDEGTVPATQDETMVDSKPDTNPQTRFLDYLKSPMVELNVQDGTERTKLIAHRAVLLRAPYFETALADDSVTSLELSDDLDALGCFLQYQYTGEYFPRRLTAPTATDGLETDPSIPTVDTTGAQLLKHARVYTLAEKLGVPDLRNLAHSKIHRINSTATGELAYARYVYGHTSSSDSTIRRPVAAFWATRSHVLRHEAEQDFRNMCLQYPQFGFDVLSLVLDAREKRTKEREETVDGTPGTAGRGRKRARPSINV